MSLTALTATLLGLGLTAPASAGISEIKISFPHQTSLLSASSVFTAGSNTADYLICGYLDQPAGGTVAAVLAWTDDTNTNWSVAFPSAGCIPIRNKATTAPTVTTSGSISSYYDLFVVGFGFWPGQAEKQGGITEPVNTTYSGSGSLSGQPILGIGGTGEATFMVGVWASDSAQTVTIGWTDQASAKTQSVAGGTGVFIIHGLSNTQILASASGGSCGYCFGVTVVKFAAPATGSGPLGDSTLGMANYDQPGSYGGLFTTGSTAANLLVTSELAVTDASGSVTLTVAPTLSVTATGGAGYLSGMESLILAASTSLDVVTTDATNAHYSAQTNLIQF